jgi:hypothetical protein
MWGASFNAMSSLQNGRNQVSLALSLFISCIYAYSTPHSMSGYDYTLRVADALLDGELGLLIIPPLHLNEFVPFGRYFYSVFPLGAVLTMLPYALLARAFQLSGLHTPVFVGALAFAISWCAFQLAAGFNRPFRHRAILVIALMLGTWMWANLTFGGAWQLALGFSVLGQLAALYFTLCVPKPFLAGAAFALAFGNRTEVLLTAPLFLYLLLSHKMELQKIIHALLSFCTLPLILGVLTLLYNYFRFASPVDFGFSRIPGVLEEPWYRDGIFSLSAIPLNALSMLWKPWRLVDSFPYVVPSGFGGSIFLASPFLLLLFRRRTIATTLSRLYLVAIALITTVHFIHGNPGGWQFSYRYAMVSLPWFFVLFLEATDSELSRIDRIVLPATVLFSVFINAWASYLFNFTNYISTVVF